VTKSLCAFGGWWLVLPILVSCECGRREVRSETRVVVEAGEERVALLSGEFVLHDRLMQEGKPLAQRIVSEDAAAPRVLEDRPDEVEARVDRARAVGLLHFSVGLALHDPHEIFEVRDRDAVEADVPEEGRHVVVEERLLVRLLVARKPAAERLPRARDVVADRGNVAGEHGSLFGVLDGVTEDFQLLQEVVPPGDLHDFALAQVTARAWHAALEDRLLRALVVGLQAGWSGHRRQDNNASLHEKS
jgi:hypothetical protein